MLDQTENSYCRTGEDGGPDTGKPYCRTKNDDENGDDDETDPHRCRPAWGGAVHEGGWESPGDTRQPIGGGEPRSNPSQDGGIVRAVQRCRPPSVCLLEGTDARLTTSVPTRVDR